MCKHALLSTPSYDKGGRGQGWHTAHVQNAVAGVQTYGCDSDSGSRGDHGSTQGCLCVGGMVPKYGRSMVGIIGVCWDVFRGRVMGIHCDPSEGELLLEHTGMCGGRY